MIRVEELARRTIVESIRSGRDLNVSWSNSWQIKDFELAVLLLQVADKILLVNALHQHHNPSGLLVVQPGQQGLAVPIDSAFAHDLRKSIAQFNWVVDNEQDCRQGR